MDALHPTSWRARALLVACLALVTRAAHAQTEALYAQPFEQRVGYARVHPGDAAPPSPPVAPEPAPRGPRAVRPWAVDFVLGAPDGAGLAIRRVWAGLIETSLAGATTGLWASGRLAVTLEAPWLDALTPTLTVALDVLGTTGLIDDVLRTPIQTTARDPNATVRLAGELFVLGEALVGADYVATPRGGCCALHAYARGGFAHQIGPTLGASMRRGEVTVEQGFGLALEAGVGVAF